VSARTALRPNTDGQLKASSSRPAASRPTSALPPATPAHTPTARSRVSGGNVAVMIDSVVGMIIAAPTPITARTAISWPASLSWVATSAPPPKTARPASRTPRRPRRSPMAPAGSRSPAKTSAYASTIHCSCVVDAPVARAMSGSATFSDDTALTTAPSEMHIEIRIRRCERSIGGSGLSGRAGASRRTCPRSSVAAY
jgi:hypothetical protein